MSLTLLALALWLTGILVIYNLVEDEVHDTVDWTVLILWPIIPFLWLYDYIRGQ